MEIKNNDSTRNRPHGERILNAPYVFANLPDYLRILKEEKAWENGDRNAITVFKAAGLSVVLTALKAGAIQEDVQTEGFISLQLIEGNVTVTTTDGDIGLASKQMMFFHPSIQYSVIAKEDSSFLLSHFNAAGEFGDVL